MQWHFKPSCRVAFLLLAPRQLQALMINPTEDEKKEGGHYLQIEVVSHDMRNYNLREYYKILGFASCTCSLKRMAEP